jgi:hypothetical protein
MDRQPELRVMVRLAASDADEAILVRNLTIAFKVSDWFAEKNHLNMWDVRDVMVTMLVTESGGGFIYANDGQGYREPDSVADRTPWNWNPQTNKPIGTPEQRARMREILRRSLVLPHDKVGSNGRSTGPAQQLSADTGGTWGPMAATMRMDLSVLMFLNAVNWSDRSISYKGKLMANWQTAMLLRVQQPLPAEVAANYGASQLARAQSIARDERFTPGAPPIDTDWIIDMADQAALDKYKAEIVEAVRNADIGGSPLAMVLNTFANDRGHETQETYRFLRGTDPNIDTLSVLLDGLSNLRRENAEIIARLDALTAAKPE